MVKYLSLLAASALSLAATAANAASPWPANVVGTWNADANQHSLSIKVTSQASSGECRQLAGSITDTGTGATGGLLGFYCPSTGRISFLRTTSGSNAAFQNYSGNVAMKGRARLMAGVFSENATPVFVGEYGFYAVK
ncbi:MAG TPA: hypothetical protein VMB71_13085 [Acetobacteraceae bacterium]|nr:hypothetical protein [Acetobacteraceae bacterium]